MYTTSLTLYYMYVCIVAPASIIIYHRLRLLLCHQPRAIHPRDDETRAHGEVRTVHNQNELLSNNWLFKFSRLSNHECTQNYETYSARTLCIIIFHRPFYYSLLISLYINIFLSMLERWKMKFCGLSPLWMDLIAQERNLSNIIHSFIPHRTSAVEQWMGRAQNMYNEWRK